jgi:galactose mutarotase-like enzyme
VSVIFLEVFLEVNEMSDWYQIENSYFTVQVTSAGAEMKRLFAKPWHRELLWIPQEEKARKIWNRSSPVLFPIVGKLKNDSYRFGGKTYQMSQHGFARDLDFECLVSTSDELEFFLKADAETFKSYPFCFELRVKYRLDGNALVVDYIVTNVDRQDIYFSIGAHPAFETPRIENYEIRFEKKEKGFYHLENGLVNWDKLNAMTATTLFPNKKLFENDALIFKDAKSHYVDLVDLRRHETIRVKGTNTPYMGIWAKESVPFVCIEPWYGVSDSEGHNLELVAKNGIQTLPMGKTFEFSYSIELVSTTGTA